MARIETLEEVADAAPFSGSVAAFEQGDEALAVLLDVRL